MYSMSEVNCGMVWMISRAQAGSKEALVKRWSRRLVLLFDFYGMEFEEHQRRVGYRAVVVILVVGDADVGDE